MPVIGLLLCSLIGWMQPQQPAGTRPVFVTASFLDRNRLYVENLGRDEIRIFENDQPREVQYMAGREVPMVYGLLFDPYVLPQLFEEPGRDSYGVSIATAAGNVAYQVMDQAFVGQSGWLGTYGDDLQVNVDFVPDSGRIKDALQMLAVERLSREPSLYTALFTAAKKMSRRNEKRRILILFIEVLDSRTGDRLKALKNLLGSSNIELFVASFTRSRLPGDHGMPLAKSEASLRELADATAGAAYFTPRETIEGMGRRISYQISSFYTVGFESTSTIDKPGKLRIECTRPNVKVTTHNMVPVLQ